MTAIEFSLVAFPLFLTIFVIFEICINYYASTALDLALQTATRQIRTGEVQGKSLDFTAYKTAVCKQMADLFGCPQNLKLQIDVIANIATSSRSDPISNTGAFDVSERYNAGKNGDFLLAQAFLPWPAFISHLALGKKTADNKYVLRSVVLFRNEPF